ncbi:MAG: hypothetical protein GXO68_05810 [Crenarchaeota archaeon]|nr:hypothetical protein [Thermoproteota archaeon]
MTANIGDFLDAQWNLGNIPGQGIYNLRINNGTTTIYLPFIITESSESLTDTFYLEKVVVYDLLTSVSVELPPNTPFIPHSQNDRFITLLYYHRGNEGRLVIPRWGIDTGWGRWADLQITFKFGSYQDMIFFMSKYFKPRVMSTAIINAIGELINQDPAAIENLLAFYTISPIINGRVYGFNFDFTNYRITVKLLIPLGFGFDEIKNVFNWLVAGTATYASIVGATRIAGIVGGPVGLVASVVITTAALYVISKFLSKGDSPEKIYIVTDKGAITTWVGTSQQQIDDAAQKAHKDIDYVCQKYNISQGDCNLLHADVDALASIAKSKIDDAGKMMQAYYDKGYRDARLKWGLIGGAAGAIAGSFIARGGPIIIRGR